MNDTAQQLDSALVLIQNRLTEWGIDDWLSKRIVKDMRFSVRGKDNILTIDIFCDKSTVKNNNQ